MQEKAVLMRDILFYEILLNINHASKNTLKRCGLTQPIITSLKQKREQRTQPAGHRP